MSIYQIWQNLKTPKRKKDNSKTQRYLLIKRWGGGFWSDVDHLYVQIAAAEAMGRTPIVQWGRQGTYGNGIFETFELYFEPVSKTTIRDMAGEIWPPVWTHKNLMDDLPFGQSFDMFVPYKTFGSAKTGLREIWTLQDMMSRKEEILVSYHHEHASELLKIVPEESRFHGLSEQQLRRLIMSESICLNEKIRKKIDQFWTQSSLSENALAVHVRGSDKILENPDLHYHNKIILERAKLWNGQIFLLTESERYAHLWKNEFGDQVLMQNCSRTANEEISSHDDPFVDGYQKGCEILIDTYTAAKCKSFIGTYSSNVGKFVAAIRDMNLNAPKFVDLGP